MTSDPAPEPPDQPPQPRPAGTWTRTQLAAQIRHASPAPPGQPRPDGDARTWTRAQLAAQIRNASQPATPAAHTAAPAQLTPATPAPPTPPAPAIPAQHSYETDEEPWWIGDEGHPWTYDGISRQELPSYSVVLHISPILRERHPEWPLSLEEALNAGQPPRDPNPEHRGNSSWTQLQGTPQAPARARAIIRETLTEWGLATLAPEAEQRAAELVTDAAHHSLGRPFGLAIDEHRPPGQPRWIRCSVSGASPQPSFTPPHAEPGRALAVTTGRDATPDGTTSWFTLTPSPSPQATARAPQRERELEPGA